MFRCHFCGQVTPPGTKKQNVVVAVREKTYPARYKEAKRAQGRFRNQRDSPKDVGGKGVETKQEVPACPSCVAKQNLPEPSVETAPVVAEVESSQATESQDTTQSES